MILLASLYSLLQFFSFHLFMKHFFVIRCVHDNLLKLDVSSVSIHFWFLLYSVYSRPRVKH